MVTKKDLEDGIAMVSKKCLMTVIVLMGITAYPNSPTIAAEDPPVANFGGPELDNQRYGTLLSHQFETNVVLTPRTGVDF